MASRSTVQASCTGIEPSTVLTGRERIRASGVSAQPLRQDADPEVAVGDDARRLPRTMTEETRSRTMVRAASPTVPASSTQTTARRTRVSHRRGQVDPERGDRRVLEARLEAGGETDREVGGEARVGEQPVELLARDPVGEQVLLDDAVERGLAGDERGVAERLALLEDLEGLAAPLEPDHPLADHVEVLEGVFAHGHELRARRVVDDLQAPGRTVEELLREAVERGGGADERDRVQGRHEDDLTRIGGTSSGRGRPPGARIDIVASGGRAGTGCLAGPHSLG